MSEETSTSPETTVPAQNPRHRTGKKRTRFKPPARFPQPVRALWTHATGQEKEAAHRICVGILEWWLGRRSRDEIAAQMELPPLRLWQLSQQAIAGMLAGVLKQPKARKKRAEPMDPENDPKLLKKELEAAKRKVMMLEQLVAILRELPANREGRPAETKGRQKAPSSPAKKRARKTPSGGPKGRRGPPLDTSDPAR